MNQPSPHWRATTHDWTSAVDAQHLAEIRGQPTVFAPGGLVHLILEVLAYAADEAAARSAGRCTVTLGADGSVSVSDNGRGTDTRYDADGSPTKKPVMATKDLRFYDFPTVEALPDGHPRRGMSVVAALSDWLVHTNRRRNGAWTQRYERGIPVTGLVPIDGEATTGTTVHFLPDEAVRAATSLASAASEVRRLARWSQLRIEVVDQTPA